MKTIEWKRIGEHVPSNAGQAYDNSPDTPFIPCLVYACSPGFPQGGVIECVRWVRSEHRWSHIDMAKWVLQPPYVITHFCDNIPKPEFKP